MNVSQPSAYAGNKCYIRLFSIKRSIKPLHERDEGLGKGLQVNYILMQNQIILKLSENNNRLLFS